jgi:RNA polymerase sigma-70 factor (sigma-E family)
MNRERAETFLRLLAEAELRRVTANPRESAPPRQDVRVTELYSPHYRALVRLAMLLVGDVPTAEEVVQDAFVAMRDAGRRLRNPENALAYLRQAVVNRSRSVLRHRAVVDKNLRKAPLDMPSAEYGALILLERSEVVAAFRGLPERQREAIVLRYYGELSEAEIAALMNISRGAVKTHTARGMTSLRAALETGYTRLGRIARVLCAVGALDEEAADQILDDFDLALAARHVGPDGQRMGRLADRPRRTGG